MFLIDQRYYALLNKVNEPYNIHLFIYILNG